MNRLQKLITVFGVTRCVFCRRLIWYSDRFGWYVWDDVDGTVTRWHTQCRRTWWLANQNKVDAHLALTETELRALHGDR